MAESALDLTPPHDGAPPIPFSPTPPLNTADVVSIFEFMEKRGEKFGKMLEGFSTTVAKIADETAAHLSAAGMPRDLQKQAAEKARQKATADVRANTSDARWEVLREMNDAVANLATTEALWASPVVILSRAGLGSPERTNFVAQLAGAGPTELRNLATFAASTNNKVLGAALVSIVDRMPRKDRPFSTAELAHLLVGEDHAKMQHYIRLVRDTTQWAININREFETGRTNHVESMKIALRNHNREKT